MNLKEIKRGFKKEKYESKLLCSHADKAINCCIWFEKKNQL